MVYAFVGLVFLRIFIGAVKGRICFGVYGSGLDFPSGFCHSISVWVVVVGGGMWGITCLFIVFCFSRLTLFPVIFIKKPDHDGRVFGACTCCCTFILRQRLRWIFRAFVLRQQPCFLMPCRLLASLWFSNHNRG